MRDASLTRLRGISFKLINWSDDQLRTMGNCTSVSIVERKNKEWKKKGASKVREVKKDFTTVDVQVQS